MCGIIGYIGNRRAEDVIIDGLKRLEYRGYDSAGIAIFQDGKVVISRVEGKLANLEKLLLKEPVDGSVGIGHTRWATHGRPSETNAHPHKAGNITLVHNGIIENFTKLRAYLVKKGHTIRSETDTEVICHLIQQRMYDGLTMKEAFLKALKEIEGSYALAVINEDEPDRLYIAKNGSPLVVGMGKRENFVASDIPALLPYTRQVAFLEDGEWGIVTKKSVEIFDAHKKRVKKEVKTIGWDQGMAEKGGYKHFMLKEIYEQPDAIADTLRGRVSVKNGRIILNELNPLFEGKGFPYEKVYIIACGTSYHAAMAGKYLIEAIARVPVSIDLASEFRYRNPMVDKKTLLIGVSQSGETADTLAAMKDAKKKGAKLLAICNAVESSIPRASDAALYTHAGPEIGVASTKAFTTQLLMFVLLALDFAQRLKKISGAELCGYVKSLVHLPQQMKQVLKVNGNLSRMAVRYSDREHFLYIARGLSFPIALEGALKLKEISYIHAEGYSAGEMKHGPIALIDHRMPVVALITNDHTYDKIFSNIEEVNARGAEVIAVACQGDLRIEGKAKEVIWVPKTPWYLSPILQAIPLQLLAYYIADHKGTDVDQPRNLAKSVTVE